MKKYTSNRATPRIAATTSIAAAQPAKLPPSKESRNKANTIRNAAKVEHFLMEVEKVHGFARSWEMRERLERGDVTLEELSRR